MNRSKTLLLMVLVSGLASTAFAGDSASSCRINEIKNWHHTGKTFLKVVSKDRSGVEHAVFWKKKTESFMDQSNNFQVWTNQGSRSSLVNGVLYPILKDGTVVTDGRYIKREDLAPPSVYGAGELEKQGKAANSEAVYACAKNGYRLPTKEEVEALQSCPDLSNWLPNMMDRSYWTSTIGYQTFDGIRLLDGDLYYGFVFGNQDFLINETRDDGRDVRCVGRAP